MEQLPEQKISTSASVIYLGDILNDFDPYNYEKATSTYRKPTYQRGLKKDEDWMVSLVESILKGRSIGGVVMSKWQEFTTTPDGNHNWDEWYNIEDGGTRLGALLKFKNKEFTTQWGDYDRPEIQKRFMSYKIPVILSEKTKTSSTRTNITDSEYFAELCENFIKLQEGTPLTTGDRYCGFIAEPEFQYKGAPIINMTLEGISHISRFQSCFGFSNINRRNNRKKIADAIALTSGIMWGPQFANTIFFKHLPVLTESEPKYVINDMMKQRFHLILELFFETIETIERKFPKWNKERFTNYFSKTKLFTGLWMTEIFKTYPFGQPIEQQSWVEFKDHFVNKWTFVANKYRSKICTTGLSDADYTKANADEWLDDTVYSGLAVGHKRNTNPEHYAARLQKINEWYNAHKE